jgi:hypothetical protein
MMTNARIDVYAYQTFRKVSSDAEMRILEASSAKQQELTSSSCAEIFTVLLSASKSYTRGAGQDVTTCALETKEGHTEDLAITASNDFVSIRREATTPYAESFLPQGSVGGWSSVSELDWCLLR